jgi:hypothetical protein
MKASLLVTLAMLALAVGCACAQPAACGTKPTLRQGSTGAAVRDLQRLLNEYGASPALVVDGDFGPRTDAAVKKHQTNHFLVVDGIVGRKTWTSLCRPVPSCGSLGNPYPTAPRGTQGWNPITSFAVNKVLACFPGQFTCSTYRSSSATSDHPGNGADCFPGKSGVCHAVDSPDYNDGSALAGWLVQHHLQLKVNYVIWQNLIWSRRNPTWKSQGKTGCSYAHYDHVHISMIT